MGDCMESNEGRKYVELVEITFCVHVKKNDMHAQKHACMYVSERGSR